MNYLYEQSFDTTLFTPCKASVSTGVKVVLHLSVATLAGHTSNRNNSVTVAIIT